MDKDVMICRCQEVTLAEIVAAIEDGASTIDGVKKRTRACMGLCQGKTCQRLIQKIVAETTGRNPSDLLPPTFRPPVRPIRMGIMEENTND